MNPLMKRESSPLFPSPKKYALNNTALPQMDNKVATSLKMADLRANGDLHCSHFSQGSGEKGGKVPKVARINRKTVFDGTCGASVSDARYTLLMGMYHAFLRGGGDVPGIFCSAMYSIEP